MCVKLTDKKNNVYLNKINSTMKYQINRKIAQKLINVYKKCLNVIQKYCEKCSFSQHKIVHRKNINFIQIYRIFLCAFLFIKSPSSFYIFRNEVYNLVQQIRQKCFLFFLLNSTLYGRIYVKIRHSGIYMDIIGLH